MITQKTNGWYKVLWEKDGKTRQHVFWALSPEDAKERFKEKFMFMAKGGENLRVKPPKSLR